MKTKVWIVVLGLIIGGVFGIVSARPAQGDSPLPFPEWPDLSQIQAPAVKSIREILADGDLRLVKATPAYGSVLGCDHRFMTLTQPQDARNYPSFDKPVVAKYNAGTVLEIAGIYLRNGQTWLDVWGSANATFLPAAIDGTPTVAEAIDPCFLKNPG